MTTLISSHVDQALGRIINESVMPIIGQLMEEIAKNAAGGVEMDLQPLLASKWEATDDYDAISAVRVNSELAPRELETWWWD